MSSVQRFPHCSRWGACTILVEDGPCGEQANTCLVRVEPCEGETGDAIERYRQQMQRLVVI